MYNRAGLAVHSLFDSGNNETILYCKKKYDEEVYKCWKLKEWERFKQNG